MFSSKRILLGKRITRITAKAQVQEGPNNEEEEEAHHPRLSRWCTSGALLEDQSEDDEELDSETIATT